MIQEDYVSFETAKLLKEKGFDEKCRALYTFWFDEVEGPKEDEAENWNIEPKYFSAPTLQMAMKWLREVHKLAINIEFQIDSPTWKWRVYHIEPSEDKHTNFQHYNTYEQACEAGIRYCLENLI